MSMPIITPPAHPISMCQAISDLMESIALEETALSHILNAEGEKLQRIIGMEDICVTQIMDANESVYNMVMAITELEKSLKEKLEFISNNLYYPTRECSGTEV